MSKQSTLIISCLAAAAAGVVVGLMLSDDTRKSFQDGAKKIGGNLLDKFSGEIATAKDVKNEVEDKTIDQFQ